MLDANRLVDLPEEIGALVKLERLSACQNALVSLPASISNLKSLTVLKLSQNKFSAIPDALGACSALEEIDLADNYLQASRKPFFRLSQWGLLGVGTSETVLPMQDLPESLGSLKRLKVLALDQNRIAAVPSAVFTGCSSLHTLTLHENPITIEVPRTSLCQDAPFCRPVCHMIRFMARSTQCTQSGGVLLQLRLHWALFGGR